MRLIDADALKSKANHYIARSTDDGHNWNELCVTVDQIDNAPTVEQPTGEWTEERLSNGWRELLYAKCSNCGESFTVHECDLEVFRKDYNYCPNCGAKKMKGEE